jgi:hypothetical protein
MDPLLTVEEASEIRGSKATRSIPGPTDDKFPRKKLAKLSAFGSKISRLGLRLRRAPSRWNGVRPKRAKELSPCVGKKGATVARSCEGNRHATPEGKDMESTSTKSQKSQGPSGRLVLELKDGRLVLYPMTDSDEETAKLLRAIADRLQCGDVAELVAA